nr:methyltransferase domain-containing protein [Gracilibacillus phocaeensis]
MRLQASTEEAIKRWDRFADQYAKTHAAHGDIHKEVLLNPVLFKLLGDVKGKRILDAGCGEGYLSRKLAQSGAKVTAVDYAERMLEIANR